MSVNNGNIMLKLSKNKNTTTQVIIIFPVKTSDDIGSSTIDVISNYKSSNIINRVPITQRDDYSGRVKII